MLDAKFLDMLKSVLMPEHLLGRSQVAVQMCLLIFILTVSPLFHS